MYKTTKDIARAEFRRMRKEQEITQYMIYLSEIFVTISIVSVLVAVMIMSHNTKKYLSLLEDTYHINLQEDISTPRLSVKEEVQRYIDSLPVPEVEVSKEISEPKLLSEVQTEEVHELYSDNELANKVKGMTPTIRTLNTSAYCPCEKCCGKTDGVTASGEKVRAWHTVASGKEYAIGTIIYIPALADEPNDGWFIVQDRGGAIKNGKLDIFLNTHEEALQYGRHTLECYVYEF